MLRSIGAFPPPKRPRQPARSRRALPETGSAAISNLGSCQLGKRIILHKRRKSSITEYKNEHKRKRRTTGGAATLALLATIDASGRPRKTTEGVKRGSFSATRRLLCPFLESNWDTGTYVVLNGSHVFSGIEQHAMYARRENPIYAACRAHKRFFLPAGSCSSNNTLWQLWNNGHEQVTSEKVRCG